MIPVAEFRIHLEKSAGIGKVIVKGIGETLKFMGKHPVVTIATVGTGVAATATANRIHDLYHIINEERERKIMKRQTRLLQGILEAQRPTLRKPRTPTMKSKIEPLR